ncbi:MAG: hypothetical protein HC819_17130 [Cyclobacteriaceae bacterium]|nr:hypothetical protein [Cyclobacteriaceae bacterium]
MKQVVLFIFFVALVYACSRTCESDYSEPIKSPVDELMRDMGDAATFSIVLNDMNTEGSIFKEYFHQYKIIKEDGQGNISEKITDWLPVDEAFFEANLQNMGMEIAAKGSDGKITKGVSPPGYGAYVGNEKYGQWKERDGGSFWEFYGKYALMSSMFNMMAFPARRSYYDDYRGGYYGTGRSYYGPKAGDGSNTYGTNSKYNTTTNKSSKWSSNSANNTFKTGVRTNTPQSSKSGSRYSNFSRSRSGGYGK